MSMGKKSNDATKKSGVALSDDALGGVTGGERTVTIEYVDNNMKCHRTQAPLDRLAAKIACLRDSGNDHFVVTMNSG